MGLDTSIALGLRPMADPLQQAGQAMTLRQLAGQQQLQQLQIAQAQQQQDQERTLADLYRGNINPDGTVNRQALFQGAASQGLGARIPGLQKGFLDTDKAAADLAETRAKTDETTTRTKGLTQDQAIKAHGFALQQLGAVTTPAQFADWAAGAARTRMYDPGEAYALTNQVLRDPSTLPAIKQRLMLTGASALEQVKATAPQFQHIDGGNRIVLGTSDPLTGQFTQSQAAPIVKAPEGFNVGPNGALSVDPAWLRAKKDISAAGASNISMMAPVGGELPSGERVLVQPANRPGAQPQVVMVNGAPVKPIRDGDKPIPESAIRSISENRNSLSKIDAAIAAAEDPTNSAALGLRNALPGAETIRQYTNPEGVPVRSLVADIGSLKIHDRTGAAMSIGEAARLKPFIPSASDSPSVAADKLRQLRVEYQNVLSDMQDAYSPSNGYKPNSVLTAPLRDSGVALRGGKNASPAPAPAAAPGAPKPGTVDGGWVFMGGDPANPASWKKSGGSK